MSKITKPKAITLYDGGAECRSEDYDDMGGGAFCITVEDSTIYDSKDARKLIRFLIRAEKWLKNKEQYKKPGPKKKKSSFTIKALNKIKIPTHTDKCTNYIVGGVSLDLKPAQSKMIYNCSNECPLKDTNQD